MTVESETIQKIIELLHLQPLSVEGGLYRETYQSGDIVPLQGLPSRYLAPHPLGTAIYYALTAEESSFSAMHSLATDEIYHFYLGDPVEFLLLFADATSRKVVLGSDLLGGQFVQFVVPANTWQGSRLAPGGTFALMGTTMAPGFSPADFTLGQRTALQAGWPDDASLISRLTRN